VTLIIGIKCEDGIVVGADGAATYSIPVHQAQTITQPATKLCLIGEDVILGVSGPISIGQTFQLELEGKLESTNRKFKANSMLKARDSIRNLMVKHIEDMCKVAQGYVNLYGPSAAQDVIWSAAMAFPVEGKSRLIQIDHHCKIEEATESLPFFSIGSGQPTADPFLAFIRRILWPTSNTLPVISDGELAVMWALRYSIEANPGHISEPIQMTTLRYSNGAWKAEQISEDRMNGHSEAIDSIQDKIRNSFTSRGASMEASPPTAIPRK
jgi:20S proteasome alpha/beta subunit